MVVSCGGGEGPLCFSRRTLSEAIEGEVEVVKVLLKANASVKKEDKEGKTALFYAVKMENLTSEKRSRYRCGGIALLVATLRTRCRRILLLPSLLLPPPLPQYAGDAS